MVSPTSATSPGHLVALVRATGGLSRQQLVETTGMSRGTLHQRLDRLVRHGLVYDAETLAGTGGRPARRVRFEDRGRVVLAVDVGQTRIRVGVTDLDGAELRHAVVRVGDAGGRPADRGEAAGGATVGSASSRPAGADHGGAGDDVGGADGRGAGADRPVAGGRGGAGGDVGGAGGPGSRAAGADRPIGGGRSGAAGSATVGVADLEAALDRGAGLVAPGERLVGVGIGVPAAVDPATGQLLRPVSLPGWAPDTVTAATARRWPVPVVVENDARAGAVGAWRADDGTLVYVKLSTGLGCGIVVGGEVLRGAGGTAGDIGHVQVGGPPPGPVPRCRCGRLGCLAAYCSGRALGARLGRGTAAVAAAVQAGDPPAVAAVEAAADVLGAALATTVTTVNPARLVLGGALGALPVVVERVRARVHATVAERSWPRVEGATPDVHVTVRGLARLVVAHVYAPDAIDAALA